MKKSKNRNQASANNFLKEQPDEEDESNTGQPYNESELEMEDQEEGDLYELDQNGIENIGNMDKKVPQRRSIVEQTHDLRVLLNKIFALRGGWVVKNVAMDFSDGFLF